MVINIKAIPFNTTKKQMVIKIPPTFCTSSVNYAGYTNSHKKIPEQQNENVEKSTSFNPNSIVEELLDQLIRCEMYQKKIS